MNSAFQPSSSAGEEPSLGMALVSKKKLETVIQQTSQAIGKKFGKDGKVYLQKQTGLIKQQAGQMQQVLEAHERQRAQKLLEEPQLALAMKMDHAEPEIIKEGQLNEQCQDILLQAYGLQDTFDGSELDFIVEIADCSRDQASGFFQSLRSSTQNYLQDMSAKTSSNTSSQKKSPEQNSPQSTSMEVDPSPSNNSNQPASTQLQNKQLQQQQQYQQQQQQQKQQQFYQQQQQYYQHQLQQQQQIQQQQQQQQKLLSDQQNFQRRQTMQENQSNCSSPHLQEPTPTPIPTPNPTPTPTPRAAVPPSSSAPIPQYYNNNNNSLQKSTIGNSSSSEIPEKQPQQSTYQQHIEQQIRKVQNLMKSKKHGGESRWGTILMWMQYESNNTVRLHQIQALASLPHTSILNQLNANSPTLFEIVEKWIRGGFDRGDAEFLFKVFDALISMPIKYSHATPSFVKFTRKMITQNTFESLVEPLQKLLVKMEKQAPKREPTQLPIQDPTINQNKNNNDNNSNNNNNNNNNKTSQITAKAVTAEGVAQGPLARGAAVKVKSQKDKPLTADEILKRNRLKRLNKQITQQASKKQKAEQKIPMQNVQAAPYGGSMGLLNPPSNRGQQGVSTNNNNNNNRNNNSSNNAHNLMKSQQKNPMVAPPPDASPEAHFQYLKQQQLQQKTETLAWEKQQLQDIGFNLQLMRPQISWQQPQRNADTNDITFGDESIEVGVQQTRSLCQPAFVSFNPNDLCVPREPTNVQNSNVNSKNAYEIPFVPQAVDEYKMQNQRLWQSDQRLKEYVVDPSTLC